MSRKPFVAREHEFEAQYGLPELLPEGEHIIWQGRPRWSLFARQAFHADKAALYFGAVLTWCVASRMADGAGFGEALASLTVLLALFALALGILLLMGWLAARTTAYTLTNKRVVMRIGIVLTVTYNLPLKCIESAGLRPGAKGCGDITLALEPETQIAWLQLWPHVRPWHLKKAEPMLRALDGAEAVAAQLQKAWVDVNGPAAMAASRELNDQRAPSPARPSPSTASGNAALAG